MWMWSTGINRNIVECKAVNGIVVFFDKNVLIETLWNVKIFSEAIEELGDLVLIETLWNVKHFCWLTN